MIEWTTDDSIAASRQGWDIFDCDGSDNGPLQIQSFDAPGEGEPDLGDDTAAWELVWVGAVAGSALHTKALAFIAQENPMEMRSIERWIMEEYS